MWRHLPQTPRAGEYLGTAAAIQLLSKPTHIVGDCLGVVKAVNKLISNPHPAGVHGGLLRDATREGRLNNVTKASWMPSHQLLKDGASAEERLWHEGNQAVDKAAGEERTRAEEEAGADELKSAELSCKMVTSILRAVGSVLAEFPPLPRAVSRLATVPKSRLDIAHEWKFVAERKYWRCCGCGTFCAGSLAQGPPARAGICRPGRSQERALAAERLGHTLDTIQIAGAPTVYCRTCGAHGSWQWRHLLSQCKEEPRNCQA